MEKILLVMKMLKSWKAVGIKHEDLERPSEGSLGGIICCNG